MMEGTRALVLQLHAEGRIAGMLGLGGGAGTAVGTAAMRALPLGIPKLMVSTLASSDVRGFVGVKDITMMPTIVDVSGLNRISRRIFAQAAGAICGMVDARVPEVADKPLIAASMFGNTTKCVEAARAIIENDGFEVLVFHATGSGGLTMEGLVEAGQIAGVLDVTLTEWADELMGGVMSAGPTRLDAAAQSRDARRRRAGMPRYGVLLGAADRAREVPRAATSTITTPTSRSCGRTSKRTRSSAASSPAS